MDSAILVQERGHPANLSVSFVASIQSMLKEIPRFWKADAESCQRLQVCPLAIGDAIWSVSSTVYDAWRGGEPSISLSILLDGSVHFVVDL